MAINPYQTIANIDDLRNVATALTIEFVAALAPERSEEVLETIASRLLTFSQRITNTHNREVLGLVAALLIGTEDIG